MLARHERRRQKRYGLRLLSQTEAFYDYTVIIEEGLSYEIYTRTVEPNARPIIIQPDGDLTINYLDTHGLPLTAEQLASAMALVAKIAGVSSDEDKQLSREAQIAKYIMLLYEDVFEEWSRRNAERAAGDCPTRLHTRETEALAAGRDDARCVRRLPRSAANGP